MATGFPGTNRNLRGVSRISELIIAPKGLTFVHAEACKLGVHDDVTISSEVYTNHEGMGGGVPDHTLYKINSKIYQATFPNFEALDTLFRDEVMVRAKVELADGTFRYLHFITTPVADLDAPSATTERMGGNIKLLINQNECTIEINMQTRLSMLQDEELWAMSTAAVTGDGETGGSTLGITPISYDRGAYTPGNAHSVQVQNSASTALIGHIGTDFEFTLEPVIEAHDSDTSDRPIANKYKYMLKGSGLNMDELTQQAWNTVMREDCVVTTTLKDGRTIVINQAMGKANVTWADSDSFVAFEFMRDVTRANIVGIAASLTLSTPTSGF